MKSIVLFLCLICFAPFAAKAQWYRHKSEAKIMRMTPAQRVDEWVSEQTHHGLDELDDYDELLRKYIMPDGVKALPRLTEIINEYDPTKFREGRKGERFDACWIMLGYLDNFALRLRASEEGRQAINALERAVARMRAAEYGRPDQHEWEQHGRFDLAVIKLNEAKGINGIDQDIRDSLRFIYKITLSDAELFNLSNYLTKNCPEYPSWSGTTLTKDESQLDGTGLPIQIGVLNKPERIYKAYIEFKKQSDFLLGN